MLGSPFDADDAVQETMVRAWRGFERFEGRSALRSWLYRIATNVCLDRCRVAQRRARPMEDGTARSADDALVAPRRATTGSSRSPTRARSRTTPTPPSWRDRDRASAWPSSPRSSTCRHASAPPCS